MATPTDIPNPNYGRLGFVTANKVIGDFEPMEIRNRVVIIDNDKKFLEERVINILGLFQIKRTYEEYRIAVARDENYTLDGFVAANSVIVIDENKSEAALKSAIFYSNRWNLGQGTIIGAAGEIYDPQPHSINRLITSVIADYERIKSFRDIRAALKH